MRRTNLKLITIGMTGLLLMANPWPAWSQSGNSTVTLSASNFASVRINTASLTLTATQTDFDNDFVERTGASGISVDTRTNGSLGCTLAIRGEAAGAGKINPADLSVKSATTGSLMAAYTAMTTVNQNMWSNASAKPNFATAPSPILVDVRVTNLGSYAAGSYTNVLTFTVILN